MPKKTFDPLQRAEKALDAKPPDYPTLVEAAAWIARLVPDNLYLAAPLLEIGKRFAEREGYLQPAIKAVEVAADHAPTAALKQEAVDELARLADALHEAVFASAPRVPTPRAAQRFVQKFKL